MLSRRDLGKLTLGALSIPAMAARKIDSVVHGIQFGLQSYIFTRAGLPQEGLVDTVIASMVKSGSGRMRFLRAVGRHENGGRAIQAQNDWYLSVPCTQGQRAFCGAGWHPAAEWYSAFRCLDGPANPQAPARKRRVANPPQCAILPYMTSAIPLSSRATRQRSAPVH